MQRSRLRAVPVFINQQRQLLVAVSILWLHPLVSWGFQFQYVAFDNIDNIALVTEGGWYKGQGAAYIKQAIWLTPDPREVLTHVKEANLGRIVYKDQIQFIDDKSVPSRTASFNTSFSFQIFTTAPYGHCASGMTFFISNFYQAPDYSDDGALGLVSTKLFPAAQAVGASRFFAVEFDTYKSRNFSDSSSSHIGIDINSVISSNFTETGPGSSLYPELHLYNNYTFMTWIEYNASSSLIQVWMTNTATSHQRPLQPCLQLRYDLSTVFQNSMYVGFSGVNQLLDVGGMEGIALYSWNFSSDDLKPVAKPVAFNNSKLLLAVAIPSVFLSVGVCSVLVWIAKRRLRRKEIFYPSNDCINIELAASTMPRYSYRELRKAAHGFGDKDKVGEGGFSSVYKGTLADGSMVAVKRLKQGLRREAEFSSEIRIISGIRHRNLLQLQGWCYEKGEAMLVYKYMTNGSLDNYLFGKKRGTLQSETRLRILVGVAGALEYLHGGLGNCVLHRDVKAANVLLTEDFEPLLGDFGLARLISHNHPVTITMAGTPGYVAPEVVYTGRATDKADVYSFGVLALEVAYGRAAMDGSLQPQEMRLVDWVWLLHQSDKLIEALDPSIQMDMPAPEEKQWRCVLHVALMCCHPSPESRPTMRHVTQALQDTVLMPLPTTKPMYPTSPNLSIYFSNPNIVSGSGSSTSTGLTPTISRSSKTLGHSSSYMLSSGEICGSSCTSTTTTLGRC